MKTLFEIIKTEAAKSGVLPFARFMELALYCPKLGYYETKKTPGRHGDFYTSVSVGELFGQLLAFQFAEWLEELQVVHGELWIVEAGAHGGTLAKDILNRLQNHRPKLFERINYIFIEPSLNRREWQRETLKEFAAQIRWFSDFENLKSKIQNPKLTGIVFSNELLDAFPIHRFGRDAENKKWFEWGVAVENDKFVWTKIPNSKFQIPNSQLESVLPDNYTIETCPAAENWWRAAANILNRGKLLTIDYGFSEDEQFSPARAAGTLRAYFHHRANDDVLARVGEQDLTAHVNFSAIKKIGEVAGLKTEFFSTQAKFLTRILAKMQKDRMFDGWNSICARQFQTLTHPEHLGHVFRVLVQTRK